MANYEALGRTLAEFKTVQPAQHTPSTVTQPSHSRAPSRVHSHTTTDPKHCVPDNIVSLRDLPFIQCREFKVYWGQVGDNESSAPMAYASTFKRD